MDALWLEGLNEAQRRAVDYGNGPLLIIAGAGTGKTRTLACRVARLIGEGVPPERILLLTFTRRAAEEMLRRAERMVGNASRGRVWGGTFHATANRLLRTYASAIGLPNDFTIMDESDAADLLNLIRSDLGCAKTDRRFPRKNTLQAIYSHTVNAQKPMRDIVERYFVVPDKSFQSRYLLHEMRRNGGYPLQETQGVWVKSLQNRNGFHATQAARPRRV